jgi:adenylate cyclase
LIYSALKSLKQKLVNNITPLIFIIGVILFQLLDVAVFKAPRERLDGLIYDLKVKRLPPWPDSVTNIQIVDIDEHSLAQIGRMPWSRDIFASLTSKLDELGAIVISYDVLFAEPEKNPAVTVISRIDAEVASANKELFTSSFINQFNYDLQFASAMQQSEVVLSYLLHKETDSDTNTPLQIGIINNTGVEQATNELTSSLLDFPGFAGLLPTLADVSAGSGFMNSFEDADGFVRRAALLAKVEGQFYPSLALETFRLYSLIDKVLPVWQTHNDLAYITGIQIGNTLVNTDHESKILVPYRGKPKTYAYTSAYEVLKNQVTDQRFEQAVVFVGASAAGLADLRSTPVALAFPGVEIQATIFDALIKPEFIPYQPEWWREALLLQLLLIGLFCIFYFPNKSPLVTTFFACGLLCGVLTLNLILWYQWFIYIPLLSPLLLVILLSAYYIGSGFFIENNKRKKVKAVFDQYVPPAHIDRILQNPDSVTLAGEKKDLTVMFSDIRGFTTISETMTAGELKLWLNQFFSPITQTILQHDGTIDKYVGDMVMAFWGAPLEEPKHASKSIDAAFDMLDKVQSLNHIFSAMGKPEATIGIGINTGEMNVGDMGSDFRRSYTVIGDAVNLGSRLEGLTKFYGVDILVGQFTQKQALDYHYWLIDKVKVKGKDEPVTIYSPLPKTASEQLIQLKNQFNQCTALYFNQQFKDAQKQLGILGEKMPNQHLITLYLQRIEYFLSSPPEKGWDGSYTHLSK